MCTPITRGKALEEALNFGTLMNMKIENMKEQYAAKQHEAAETKVNVAYVPVDPSVEYGFVAVAAGEGLRGLFTELGADQVVSGGQTMNPSTEDILAAIHATPAKTVFVLPNNKNIIMAAEQAVQLADRKVCVLQTRTIPQGLSAMLAFDPDASFADNRTNMTAAFDQVHTGQITFAARDSDFDGPRHQARTDFGDGQRQTHLCRKRPLQSAAQTAAQHDQKIGRHLPDGHYRGRFAGIGAEEEQRYIEAKYGDRYELISSAAGSRFTTIFCHWNKKERLCQTSPIRFSI